MDTRLTPLLRPSGEGRTLQAYAGLATLFAGLFGGGLAAASRRGAHLPERVGVHDVTLYGVATHRLSRLLSRERVTRFARAPFTEVDEDAPAPPGEMAEHARPNGGLRRAVGELLSCTLCLDQWVAGGFVVGHVAAPRATRAAASALAISAAADVLQIAYARSAAA